MSELNQEAPDESTYSKAFGLCVLTSCMALVFLLASQSLLPDIQYSVGGGTLESVSRYATSLSFGFLTVVHTAMLIAGPIFAALYLRAETRRSSLSILRAAFPVLLLTGWTVLYVFMLIGMCNTQADYWESQAVLRKPYDDSPPKFVHDFVTLQAPALLLPLGAVALYAMIVANKWIKEGASAGPSD